MLQLLGSNPDKSPPHRRSCPTSNDLRINRPSLVFACHAQPGCRMPLAYSGGQTAGRIPAYQRPAARPALASQPWPSRLGEGVRGFRVSYLSPNPSH